MTTTTATEHVATHVVDQAFDEAVGRAYPYVTPRRAREIREEVERDRNRGAE